MKCVNSSIDGNGVEQRNCRLLANDGHDDGCRYSQYGCADYEITLLSTSQGKQKAREDCHSSLKALDGQISAGEVQSRLDRAGVPFVVQKAVWGHLNETAAMAGAREWTKTRSKRFLYLKGHTGVGKTVAAAWAMREFAFRYKWNSGASGGTEADVLMFCRALEIGGLSKFEQNDTDFMNRLERAKFVIIDDLSEEGTEYGRKMLAALMAARLEAQRWTVITGNLQPGQLKEKYGERIADRLRTGATAPDLSAEKKSMRVPNG